MRSLGDKISSTIVAQMPWSGTGVTETVLSKAGYVTVPNVAYASACIFLNEPLQTFKFIISMSRPPTQYIFVHVWWRTLSLGIPDSRSSFSCTLGMNLGVLCGIPMRTATL